MYIHFFLAYCVSLNRSSVASRTCTLVSLAFLIRTWLWMLEQCCGRLSDIHCTRMGNHTGVMRRAEEHIKVRIIVTTGAPLTNQVNLGLC